MIAIGDELELGIDVEEVANFNLDTRLIEMICTQQERAVLEASPSRAGQMLAKLWTRKEALLKAKAPAFSSQP